MTLMTNICLKCDGHCCFKYTIYITSEDAIRMAKNLEVSPIDYLTYYEPSYEIEKICPTLKIDGVESVLAINYQKGFEEQERYPCYFFNSETGFCKIHKFKPLVCRIYPFSLDNDGNIIVEANVCPENWEIKDNKIWKNNFKKYKKELEMYKKKARTWNEKAENKNFSDFLTYLNI